MRQHVIPRWLLSRFSRSEAGGLVIAAHNKLSGECRDDVPTRFMVERDDHDDEIEIELGRIEGPAANAAHLIDERTDDIAPGVWRIADATDANVDVPGPELRDGGVIEEMRLMVGDRQLRRLPSVERDAMARFMALMYSRAPKIQRAVDEIVRAYVKGIGVGISGYGQRLDLGATTYIGAEIERSRWHGLREADRISQPLTTTTWWIIKARPEQSFVLGDSTVLATLALGHDDQWRRLIDPDSYAVIMPISPATAIVVGRLIPMAVPAEEFVGAVNLLSWKWAEDYIMSTHCGLLAALRERFTAAGWSNSAPASVDSVASYWRGIAFVHRALVENQPASRLLDISTSRLQHYSD